MNWLKALEEVGNKVGILAALFAGYLYMEERNLDERVSKLEIKTESISDIRADLSSIKGQLDLIIKLNVNKDQK